MTEPEPLAKAEFELTPEEWVSVSLDQLWDTELHRRARRKQQWLCALIAVAGLALLSLAGPVSLGVLWAVVFGVTAALMPWLYRRALRRALTANARTGIAPGFFGPHRLEVRTEGLRDVTPAFESTWRWHTVESVGQVDGTFVIRVGPFARLILPSSAFRDGADLRRFSQHFYAQIEDARRTVGDGGPEPHDLR